MSSRGTRSIRCRTDQPHARTRWDASPRRWPGSWRRGLVGLGRPRVVPGVGPLRITRSRVRHPASWRNVLRLGVTRPRPPDAFRSNRRDGHYGRTSRHRPDPPLAGRASSRVTARHGEDVADRRGQAPLLRFGPLQHLPVRGASCSGRMPASRMIPASAFSPAGPRALVLTESAASALAVLRCDKLELVPPLWRTSRSPVVARKLLPVHHFAPTPARRRPSGYSEFTFRRTVRTSVTSSATVAGANAIARALAVALPHPAAPARACLVGASHSSRPFLARDVPDPQFHRPPRPGRAVRFFPLSARRRSWGCALRRFTPAAGGRADGIPRLDATTPRGVPHSHRASISARPGPPAVCRIAPAAPTVSVEVIAPPVGRTTDLKGGRP